jgi:hypothetical protein
MGAVTGDGYTGMAADDYADGGDRRREASTTGVVLSHSRVAHCSLLPLVLA